MQTSLEKIYNAGLKFLVPLSISEVYKIIVDEAVKLVGAGYGSIILVEDGGDLKRVYSSSPRSLSTKPRKRANTYKAIKKQQVIMIDVQKVKNAHPELLRNKVKWVIFIPLSYKKQSIGVLIVNSFKQKKFSKKELQTLKLFGSIASLSVKKAQLYQDLEDALETRNLFISMAAHELRTPLTSINCYLQLLRKRFDKSGVEEEKWIYTLHSETARLIKLVNELLETSRIHSGKLVYHFTENSLKEIIGRSLDSFRMNYPERKVIYHDGIAKDDVVICDYDKIMQVILNFLDNAAKFSPADQEISLNLKENTSYVVVEIIDKGKGISPQDLPYVFKKFYKGEQEFKPGMGLGLFLAKNIIQSHKGVVDVKSKVNYGTKMCFKLPKVKINH